MQLKDSIRNASIFVLGVSVLYVKHTSVFWFLFGIILISFSMFYYGIAWHEHLCIKRIIKLVQIIECINTADIVTGSQKEIAQALAKDNTAQEPEISRERIQYQLDVRKHTAISTLQDFYTLLTGRDFTGGDDHEL